MIALAVALGAVVAGCGATGSPGGQVLSGLTGTAGTSQEDDASGPSLLPAAEPAVEVSTEQQPPAAPAVEVSTEQQPPAAPAEAARTVAEQAPPAAVAATTAAPPTASTTIPVTAEGAGPAPEGGHPPAPQAGMIPREHSYWDYPTCPPGPPWASDCYPPTEWETPQDVSDCFAPYPDLGVGGICASGPTDETPRWTTDVIRWTSWCFNQPRGNCTWLLYEMKWALDYLGAHPWCVLNEYQDRADAYGAGYRGTNVQDHHGWHNCATVIDPLVTDPPAGRSNDAGLLLSETVSLAEQCRAVLPADVELETRTRLFTDEPDQRFGSDCDAWADWVENRPKGRDRRECDRSARLAEEWMEHHHATPERYFIVYC